MSLVPGKADVDFESSFAKQRQVTETVTMLFEDDANGMSRAIRYTEIYFHQQSFAQIISVAIRPARPLLIRL
jgi:hypothetical protein